MPISAPTSQSVAMKSAGMRSYQRGRNSRKQAREGLLGQSAIVIGIGAVLAVAGLFATGEYVTTRAPERTVVVTAPGVLASGPASAIAAATVPGDNLIYRGSILFMPEYGHNCRQLFFNNLTGRLTDNGKVDCLAVLTEVGFAPPTQQPNATFRVISDSFR
jgi:hypothetical protein